MRVAGSVALCAALLTATAALPDSLTYHNDRFGTEVTFPAEVFSRAEPAPTASPTILSLRNSMARSNP